MSNEIYHQESTIKVVSCNFESNLKSIKKYGLGAVLDNRLWDYKNTIYDGDELGVFLDADKECAIDFVTASEKVWEDNPNFDEEKDIIVFEIDTRKLDKTQIFEDYNTGPGYQSFFYNGIIPFKDLKIIK